MLDIGCGPGNFTAAHVELGADVVGVDLAPGMVEVAAERNPQIEFRVANAESLPFDAGFFDVVVGGYVVHHFARPQEVFKEVSRVLKPAGRFIFVIPIQEAQASFGAFFAALGEHHTQETVPGGPLLFETDPGVIERMLCANGFAEAEVERRDVMCHLDSVEVVIRGGWEIANLRELPADVQARIEASTRRNAEPYRTDDGYAFPDAVLLGIAVK